MFQKIFTESENVKLSMKSMVWYFLIKKKKKY